MDAVQITRETFEPAQALAAFTNGCDGSDGAIVSFTGLARDLTNDGSSVTALTLETYRSVTLASMQAILDAAQERFAISKSLVIHRAGVIAPNEAIVFVATASAHRRAAFEAADYMMDRLKTEAVFWKSEQGPQGHKWIEPTQGDIVDTERWAV
ncbi:molybdenum cofactor biosynthesis protein MoaE [Parasphingorhabdus sp.]|uniref:molybdenum cofactor biosynthesis protein MoaE n=1 Tax=Parasphingorhabdus sp. TaxID=2709688 RepID=UPI003A91406B